MPQLATNDLCTGCNACVSVCLGQYINMNRDDMGFLYPVLEKNNKCLSCGRCENVCPVLFSDNIESQKTIAYAAFSRNFESRRESSSGGVFSEIASKVLESRGIVYGAAYDEEFLVQHICVTDEKELFKLRGAKYSQSDLGSCFQEIKENLEIKKKVLFSGTPCQVAGLKAYLKKDYDNLICLDFVCHGVPSPMAWKMYVQYRAQKDNAGEIPLKINLRSKHTGWSRYQYSNLYEYSNDIQYSEKCGSELYMKLFVGDYINRKSCSQCKFKGYARASDVTLGDFWGIWDIFPEMDDDNGTSLVLVHSSKGEKILSDIKSRISIKQVSLEQASQQNPSLLVSSVPNEQRDYVLKLIKEGKMDEVEKLLQKHEDPGRKLLVKNKLRSLWHRI